jgi:hypothetical protein
MRRFAFALITLTLTNVGTLAMAANVAASELRRADEAVAHQTLVTQRAIRSGDVATIAVERAKLKAVRAVSWGKRHPAVAPAKVVAVK